MDDAAGGRMSDRVSLVDLLGAAANRRIAFAPETAGYLVLELAHSLQDAPRAVAPAHLGLLVDEGRLVLGEEAAACSAGLAEVGLRRLLARLLESAAGRAPALARIPEGEARGSLEDLAAELEAALVPLNRSAAERAVSRLGRDLSRLREGVDLAAVEAQPASPPGVFSADELAERFIAGREGGPPRPGASPPLAARTSGRLSIAGRPSRAPGRASDPAPVGALRLPVGQKPRRTWRAGRAFLGLLFLLAGAGSWLLASRLVDAPPPSGPEEDSGVMARARGWLGTLVAAPASTQSVASPAASSLPSSAPLPPDACEAAVVFDDAPPDAEIYLRQGPAPRDIALPALAPAVFLVTAEGYGPVRAPLSAQPVEGADTRLELLVELGAPGNVGAASEGPRALTRMARAGRVRVLASRPGANVWSLVAEPPARRVTGLGCSSPAEFVLARYEGDHPLYQSLRLSAADLVPREGEHSVAVRARVHRGPLDAGVENLPDAGGRPYTEDARGR